MRIAHVIPTYVPAYRYGGPVRAVHGLARAQANAGDHVEVFTTDRDGDSLLDVPTDHAVEIDGHLARYFPVGRPQRLARSTTLARALEAAMSQFQLLHLHSVFLWPTAAAASLARRARRPYVLSPRGMLDRALISGRGALRKHLWIALVERRNLRGAARIVVTSAAEAGEIRRLGLNRAPLAIVPNGVDLEELAAPDARQLSQAIAYELAAGPYVLYLGRLSWKKRLEPLVDGIARLQSVRLLLAGPDDEGLATGLLSRAGAAGAADRIRWLGPVAGADRAALLHGATALALLSTAENFGNAVLEAMACGVPAVVSRGVALASEVERAEAGVVIEADPAAVAAALGELLRNRERAEAMGGRGRALVLDRFTWPVVARAMRALYEEILAA